MKILHTADWHLGDRLGRIDRTADLRAAVERVAGYCKREAVDVLLVAGDLFSELARPDGLRETIRHWQDVVPRLPRIAAAPSSPSPATTTTRTSARRSSAPCRSPRRRVGQPGETVPPGRLYLAADPTFLRLEDRTAASRCSSC